MHGDTALVSCTENILSGGPAEDDGSAGPLVGGLVVATNVFRRGEDGSWKVWSHHGSPVLVERDEDDDEDGETASRPRRASTTERDVTDSGHRVRMSASGTPCCGR